MAQDDAPHLSTPLQHLPILAKGPFLGGFGDLGDLRDMARASIPLGGFSNLLVASRGCMEDADQHKCGFT